MVCNTLSWTFLAIAGYNILHHDSFSKWYGPQVKGVNRGDRHAGLRTGERSGEMEGFRGPLKMPFIGGYLKALQKSLKDGDGTRRMRGVRHGKAETVINNQLGTLESTHHYPADGGFVGKGVGDWCRICKTDGSCLRSSKVFFRGFPYHRKDDWSEVNKAFAIELALDFRRLCCIICAFLLFLIQFCLCFSELAPTARWQFRSQYQLQKDQWVQAEGNKGTEQVWTKPLLPSECSYFKWSAVPVTYVGDRNLDAAVLTT